MDERTSEIFNDSFERCLSKDGFLPRFYELFLNSSPEVNSKFKNTDFVQQTRILRRSLYTLTMATLDTAEVRAEIERLGKTHGRSGLGVQAYMYDLWLACLLRAVREFDIGWTPEVDKTWREIFEPRIETLKRYS